MPDHLSPASVLCHPTPSFLPDLRTLALAAQAGHSAWSCHRDVNDEPGQTASNLPVASES